MYRLLLLGALGALLVVVPRSATAQQGHAEHHQTEQGVANNHEVIYPPWPLARKNPATELGEEFTIPGSNLIADLHGNPMIANFVIYSFGHYYGLLAQLTQDFMERRPEQRGRIFYQTLPFGVITSQLENGGTLTMGNLTITVLPDAFMGGREPLQEMVDDGKLEGPVVPYMSTDMAIMVRRGNPAGITSLQDLGKPGIRLAMPNPETSGTARNAVEMLRKAGGEELVEAIYTRKVENGETTIIPLHHRQTPMMLMAGEIDAGITWRTEAVYQEMVGNPITYVRIPDEQNVTGVFAAARVPGARNPEAAQAWLAFLTSPEARARIERFGFTVYREPAAHPGG